MPKMEQVRQHLLNLWMLGSSLTAIVVGFLMIIYCSAFQHIEILKPYFLYFALMILGLAGLRYYLKEVEF